MFFTTVIILLAGHAFSQTWVARGSNPQDYDMGGDPTISHGSEGGCYIQSIASEIDGFGDWMVQIESGNYLNKGIRISAFVMTENVENSAHLWVRVDGLELEALSFDYMDARPISGTTDWKLYEILVDVPEGSLSISYGIRLIGTGIVQVDGLKVEQAFQTWSYQNSGIYETVLGFELIQNHPNPFSHSTTIHYVLSNSDYVTLNVVDLTGKVVESLVNGFQPAGEHHVEWTPKDLPGGVYIYQLQGGETSDSKKLILRK